MYCFSNFCWRKFRARKFFQTRTFNLSLLILSLGFLLSACQGGVNHGTSSHVTTGAVSFPINSTKPTSAKNNPPPKQPASKKVTQQESLNPEQGQPLGDNTEVSVSSLQESAQEFTDTKEETWLSRYPNLEKDFKNHQEVMQNLEQEAQKYQARVNEFKQEIATNWRGSPLVSDSSSQLVKYTDNYHSRSAMDFEAGKLVVETTEQKNPQEHLKKAIVASLLMPLETDDPEIYSAKNVTVKGPALLAGQVEDHEGKPIKWRWRAERYADYLVANKMQTSQQNGQTVHRVEIPLASNHDQIRGQQFEDLVRKAAQEYKVDESLIYAIMETESHFNPYATSHVPAYGLMQIVPSTAGKDVFLRIKQRNDQPTQNYLFNPANNIDTGTAYLTILRDVYLKDIRNPQAREYAIISGYNGGAGNVLRTFHSDRKQAVAVINQLSPQQVYQRLHQRHPSAEARGYIEKVTRAQQKYRALAQNSFGSKNGAKSLID